MTPTILGRWQTRFFLLFTIGFLITLYFGWLFDNYTTPIIILIYVTVFGIGWDILYNVIQSFRWDRDWPPAYQLFAGIWEGLFLWALIQAGFLWGLFGLEELPGVPTASITLGQFLSHYCTVWFVTFLASQSLMRLLFPRWRFRGGQWL